MRGLIPVLAIAALLGACGAPATSPEQYAPREVDARSREYIAQFARGQVDSTRRRFSPALRTAGTDSELVAMAAVLRDARFDTVRVLGVQTNTVNDIRHVKLTYELHSQRGWALAHVQAVDSAGTWFVEGMSARALEQTLEVTNALSFSNTSVLHNLWIMMAVACSLLSLGSAIFLATRRRMPKRWRWVLLSLVGLGAFRLNWTTGATQFALLQIHLGSAAFVNAGAGAPWILTFSIPLGAWISVSRYRKWLATRQTADIAPAVVSVASNEAHEDGDGRSPVRS